MAKYKDTGAGTIKDNGAGKKEEWSYSAGNESAPKSANQGPNKSYLEEHKLQHADYGAITGGESTKL